MKYSEANKKIEALSSKYSIDMDEFSGYFNINYKGVEIAFVSSDGEYSVGVWDSKYFHKLPFSNKLYMILAELAITPLDERVEEKKYQVKVFGNYLNVPVDDLLPFLFYGDETEKVKTRFTLKEIEELKQRDDVPLDWDKVILEEAQQ
ncbi:hypothetical protein [Lactobacillus phage Satyr]|uniref:Uncharacterized protein n=2 Tax=Maenadvirus TaxID=2733162 RepID=A0A2K9V577_9CAUD|nr:hypothetical protein HOS71_gp024 [Lactobacillus phage Satyr]YP_009798693.1 hypothetical protein HOS85_gp023 [Lactobacillus phage Maenad]AUV57272.1 hypothetical protein [Lactobacillus phage Satyr]AVH85597.1 hypothetical protein [Lactobacillus phage Maenad]